MSVKVKRPSVTAETPELFATSNTIKAEISGVSNPYMDADVVKAETDREKYKRLLEEAEQAEVCFSDGDWPGTD